MRNGGRPLILYRMRKPLELGRAILALTLSIALVASPETPVLHP